MKNIWKSLFVAALFVSCSESMTEEAAAPEVAQGKAIKFEVVNEGGRAAFFQGEGHGVAFEEGDKIGIRHYTGDSSEDNYAYGATISDTDEKNAWLNVNCQRGNYQFADGQWTMFEANANWQEVSFVDGAVNTICAYYPSSNNRYAHQITSLKMSASQVQAAANDHSHIGDYMIMMADPQKFAAGDQPETVNLLLQNILSIVEVTLKSEVETPVLSLSLKSKSAPLAFETATLNTTKKISFEGAPCPITVDEDKGVNEVVLSMSGYAPATAEGSKFYFVVLPGVHAANDITLTATLGNGAVVEKEMSAIEFKMNKVYRPVITLTNDDLAQASQAEILHTYQTVNGGEYQPAYFTNEELYVLNRTYVLRNVPAWLSTYQFSQGDSNNYPVINTITATTEGLVYVVVKSSLGAEMAAAGWSPVTPVEGDDVIYYGSASNASSSSGTVAVFARYMAKDEVYDLKQLYGFVSGFQSALPMAKKVTVEKVAGDVLFFNFKSVPKNDAGASWKSGTSMTNCQKASVAYLAPNTYKMDRFTGLEFTFSYTLKSGTEGDSAATYYCTCYRKNTSSGNNIYELLVQPADGTTETIGFPIREGYKLVRVEGLCASGSQNQLPTLAITSDAEGTAKVGVVEGSTDTTISIVKNQATPWIFTIPNAEKDTRYYLAVSNKYLAIASIYLTYEKVE